MTGDWTNPRIEATLDALYAELPDPVQLPPAEHAQIESAAGRHSAAYGEPLPRGLFRTLAWASLTKEDHLLDIGSGTGRILLHAALQSPVGQLDGIEISAFRHQIALAARARLAASPEAGDRDLPRRVRFQCADFREQELPPATVIWAGITAFPPKLRTLVARRVLELESVRLFFVTHPLEASIANRFEELGRLYLPTTWTHRLPLFVLRPR